ncbi:putative aspartyl protease [Altererythrobacter atlanticus]|uniref:Uncharacterized protein n=1 Tax=Croceibacterium atlanticum TaxID=1267766 RepID=A0A0F7KW96_9SPHN|nr:aspartyl protease family protein [Croceibacterium atlanticum]AKH43989.1 hypothetical protein WYH_02963 [Croceibacterium atlanticum]MBB5732295.1 putative aspartyl protease [Croceibacterium atlanticum]
MTWHLLAAALASVAGGAIANPAETADKTTQAPQTDHEVIALEQERYRRLTVPVTIQGQGPFRFLIDTGSQATVLSHDLADLLQLTERRTAILVAMASRMPIETVDVRDLTLGSRSFYIQTAPLLDAIHIGDADGILGLDSLQDQRVLIDFVNSEIAVADAEELGGNRGFEIVVKARRRLGQLIITRAMLDGVRTAVIVDTGAQGSVGNRELQRRLRNARVLGQSELTDVNGQQMTGSVMLARSLAIDNVQLTHVPIFFGDSPTFRSLKLDKEPALVLGIRELKMFRRVAIDFRKGQILFDLPRSVRRFDSMYGGRIGL